MRRVAVLILAVFALALAACGGGSHSSTSASSTTTSSTSSQAPRPTISQDCSKGSNNTAAICILRNQKPPRLLQAPRAPILRGLDAWGPPPLSVLDGNYQFGAAYLSYDPSKNWNLTAVRIYRNAGKGVVMVWETSATRSAQGFQAGVSDAREASRQAAALGNSTGPIDFAIDFDATCSQITGYFQGVHSVVGSRSGAYGGFHQIGCLSSQHLVNHQNWQTYAWSSNGLGGTLWQPASVAPLEQWLNGSTYDYDRALLPAYGQAFQAVVPPAPKDPYAIMDKTVRHFKVGKTTVTASEHNTMTTWHNRHCVNPVKRAVCKSSHYHLVLLRGRLYRVSQHKNPHWAGGRGARFTVMSKALAQK